MKKHETMQEKKIAVKELRELFIKFMTEDSLHTDMRKKDYNQAIFIKNEPFKGQQVFNGTNIDMVLEKFDKACKIYNRKYADEK